MVKEFGAINSANKGSYKRILAACVISCMFLATPAFAAGADTDVSKLGTPTLDTLAGQEIPDGNGAVYPNSGYTLKEVFPADIENLPHNVITKYEIKEITKYYDPTTGVEVAEGSRQPDVEYKEVVTKETIPHYYEVNLANTNYGSGTQSIIFNWELNDGKYTLKESADISGNNSIIYNYDGTSHSKVTNSDFGDYGDITGNFIGNYAEPLPLTEGNDVLSGGAIYNFLNISTPTIGDITGDFIGNYASSTEMDIIVQGGAIYNYGTIGNITGDFIGNYASGKYHAAGGAIYNYWSIGNITGDFIGNYASGKYAYGGAILNYRSIGNITGDFIGNYVSSTENDARGGAIANYWSIGNITGDFIGNYASSTENVAYGGAIFNSGTIGDITGDFIGNYASGKSNAYGGAIDNRGTIGDITGDFIGNYASSTEDYVQGGAIYNDEGTIGNITGDFIGNYASSTKANAYGGAIYNDSPNSTTTIGDITGDFIGNYASSTNSYAYGGAIFNASSNSTATIGDITGDFIGNYVSAPKDSAYGGAIYNNSSTGTATIGDITGDFIGNYASGKSNAYGGAIYTNHYDATTTIGDITGDFIGNYALSTKKNACGGAIFNATDYGTATIGDITGDFIGNYAISTNSRVYGGVIYNQGTIGNITGDFIGNYASGESFADGGAIYNDEGTIGNITGDFIGNYASSTNSYAYGGAIYNEVNLYKKNAIGDITGDFIGNYASSTNSYAYGGAIYNNTSIGQLSDEGNLTGGIYGSFTGNYAETTSNFYLALGGAVYTRKDMNFIADGNTITFKDNYTKDSRGVIPNAIFVETSSNSSPTISLIANNSGKILFYDQIDGGKVSGTTIDRTNHYNLSLTGDGSSTIGLYNDITNANITSDNVSIDFINNDTKNYDVVSFNANNTKLNIDVDLTNKTSDKITTSNTSTGTVVINSVNFIGATEEAITVQVINNNADDSNLQLALGDNIHTVDNILNTLTDNVFNDDVFMQEDGINITTTNTANDSLIIYRDKIYDTLELITSKESSGVRNFTFQTADTYNLSQNLSPVTEGTLNINGTDAGSVINANGHTLFDLQNNTTLNISNTTLDNAKDFAINGQNPNAVISLTNSSVSNTDGTGINSNVNINITADNGKSEFSGNKTAIKMNNNSGIISLNSINNGNITVNDIIDGSSGYSVNFNGDKTSNITINNDIKNAVISLDDTNLYLGREDVFSQSSALNLNSGNLYLTNNAIGNARVPLLSLNGTTNLSVDVDLENEIMDRVTADNYNIADDAVLNVEYLNLISTTEKNNVKILFADEQLSENVQYTGDSPISYKGTNTVYSPIYKYDVEYSVNEDDGLGYFWFNRAGGGSGNPSDAFNPTVLAQPAAAQSGGQAVISETMHFAFQHADTFSILPSSVRLSILNNSDNRYAINDTVPFYSRVNNKGFWVRPFTTFESMDLKNGPNVDAVTYGTLIGFDTDFQEFGHGWYGVTSGYVGYNGASLSYSGVDTIMNGGLLGTTQTFYKGNFFSAITLTAGGSAGSSSSKWGSEDFAMLLAGIGSKTGYNIEFNDGKFIVQPLLALNYSFVNTFDYTNAQGVSIKSDPVHNLQINPAIRLIGNLKNGWQPYASVGMVWNVLNSSHVTANDIILPKMSVKPYVEYGLGVQKNWSEKFSAFLQAMVRNGGRTGVALSAGFRWAIGEEPSKNIKDVKFIKEK